MYLYILHATGMYCVEGKSELSAGGVGSRPPLASNYDILPSVSSVLCPGGNEPSRNM